MKEKKSKIKRWMFSIHKDDSTGRQFDKTIVYFLKEMLRYFEFYCEQWEHWELSVIKYGNFFGRKLNSKGNQPGYFSSDLFFKIQFLPTLHRTWADKWATKTPSLWMSRKSWLDWRRGVGPWGEGRSASFERDTRESFRWWEARRRRPKHRRRFQNNHRVTGF